jgi:hypothetical protein
MTWQSVSVFTSEPGRLLLAIIAPLVEAARANGLNAYWEPGHIGGRHWRVRFGGALPDVERSVQDLVSACAAEFAARPTQPDATYDVAQMEALERLEAGATSGDAAQYRVNAVETHSYPDSMRAGSTAAGIELSDAYRTAICPLTLPFVDRRDEAFVAMLRAYWVHAATVANGDVAEGCVSFKSHWSGFFSTCEHEIVLDRIEQGFFSRRAALETDFRRIMAEITAFGAPVDPWLASVWHLTIDTGRDVRRRLAAGEQLTTQASSVSEQEDRAAEARQYIRRPNEFLSIVWDDPRFLAGIQWSPEFLFARAMTNLLYMWLPLMGLSALDRQVLCRFAFGTAEAVLGEDLTARVARNRAHIIQLGPATADGR